MRERPGRTVDALATFLKSDRESVDPRFVQNFTKDCYLDDVALKALVEENLALPNVKDVTLQQLFDFKPVHQVLKAVEAARCFCNFERLTLKGEH